MRWRVWLFGLLVCCMFGVGCRQKSNKKPDATKGVVTGVVICNDTGKPARFAWVILTRVPKTEGKPEDFEVLAPVENTTTDLDGRFRLEAVEPGQYYAYATLEGYLEPERGIDVQKVLSMPDDKSKALEAIRQWKDHLVEVTVGAHRISDISLAIDRGAEIRGTVSYDDGSPAIGMHFQLARRKAKGELTDVAYTDSDQWSLDNVSDGHGQYAVPDLEAGEYVVCALMPADTQNSAPRVCLGDTFRPKNAKTVKVEAGEVADGVDIVIPLSGLHTVAGTVSVLADGHAPSAATVRLLYADDREELRKVGIQDDGSFALEYVPEDKYVVRVTDASDAAPKAGGAAHPYADMEIPLMVKDDVSGVSIQLKNVTPVTPQSQ